MFQKREEVTGGSIKKDALKNVTIFTGKQVFSFEYYKILRTTISKNICERLLLKRDHIFLGQNDFKY